LRVAERLEKDQISAEVIDLRSIRPFDVDTIIESVKKTNRAVVVQEQWRWFSVASEVAALIQEQAFDYLDAPVERVSGAEAPAPYSKSLEAAAFPNEQDVIDAARRSLYRKA
jgi:pyruvate dehydrogenase E1 component beta subunit